MKFKLGIVATHPIQYQAPWFRALARHPQIDLEVLFGHQVTAKNQSDAGFGVQFEWDTPLLDGYRSRFLRNVSADPSPNYFSGIDTPEIGPLIRSGRYDAVILSSGWYVKSSWQTIVACWRSGTPVMVRSDSNLKTARSSWKKAAKSLVYRAFIPRLDACLPVGKWSEEYFLRYGAKKERIFLVPHVVDEERFSLDPASGRREALRRQWGLDPSAIVYLCAGKFIPRKRPHDFVRAIALAAKDSPSVQGLMVGDGPLRAECEALARETGAPVRFAGFLNQSQMVDGYLAADALVFASDAGETWGLVVNEAMLCSRPCMVTDLVGCGPDLVVPGVTGDVFPCRDVKAMAACFTAYNADRLAAMGVNAKRHMAGYSIQVAVDRVIEALENVGRKQRSLTVAAPLRAARVSKR